MIDWNNKIAKSLVINLRRNLDYQLYREVNKYIVYEADINLWRPLRNQLRLQMEHYLRERLT